MTSPWDPDRWRQSNRARVIQALLHHPASTRTALGELTGLSRPTVSGLVDELLAAGMVATCDGAGDDRPRGAGRPAARVSLVPGTAFAVGLDIGHRHVRAAVCDLAGSPLADRFAAADVDEAPQESLELTAALVNAVIADAGIERSHVIGVGLGIAAPVNTLTGTVHVEGILPGWTGLDPAGELERRLGLAVQIDNDANVGALGEHAFGAGRHAAGLAYVRLSAGIGLGLVLGGRPYRGTVGVAGELGHVRAQEDGIICRCGNRGCLETVASPVAVADLVARSRRAPVDVPRLLELVAAGDRGARRAVEDAGAAVGAAVASVVNVLNPDVVVLGGELAAAGPVLIAPIEREIARRAVGPAASAVRVVQGELGEHAEVLGAAAMLLGRAPDALEARLVEA